MTLDDFLQLAGLAHHGCLGVFGSSLFIFGLDGRLFLRLGDDFDVLTLCRLQ